MNEAGRSGPVPPAVRVLASKIQGHSEQQRVVSERVMRGRCVECAGKRDTSSYLCAECRKPFPIIEEIGRANGWIYQVHALGHPYMGEYRVVRTGAYGERTGRVETLALCFTAEQARKQAQSRINRGRAAANMRMW